ncbi:MAG TPA: hypothetical protein VK765_07235 [Solirubrobacteraceae bacterium]|jgi:hypothetical protein|nr:hypothetical protein [Solirubrobacteraceae bacterium]
MESLYAAHGLRLSSTFELPGMCPATRASKALPELVLTRVEPRALERAWRCAIVPAEWRGRLGDGREFTIERGAAGDVLFSYGEEARFHLDTRIRRLDCAAEQDGPGWQRALIGKVIPAISVMRGYEGLHAAAVESPAGVVAIMGPSGAGKSTLALELMSRGWPLFADDVLVLSHAYGAVSAHPAGPHMNVSQSLPDGLDAEAVGSTIAALDGELWLAARASTPAAERRPVAMLCLLERGPGLSLGLEALAPSPLPLSPYILGLSSDPKRQRSRFDMFADLVQGATLVRVSAGPGDAPSELAELLERALARQRQPSVGALA